MVAGVTVWQAFPTGSGIPATFRRVSFRVIFEVA